MTGALLVFAGPTLRPSDCAPYPDISLRPPVGRGDILAALNEDPEAIGIVDGWFGDRPSVGHKEIVEALALGVRVYGAASMGALRACELASCGMIGVGRIFRAYRSGRITSDAAVAVAHGPVEIGCPPVSVAEVDVTATLDDLTARGGLDRRRARDIARAAADLPFAERTWPAIARAAAPDAAGALAATLAATLAAGHVEAKRRDARALLALMRHDLRHPPSPRPAPPPPRTPSFAARLAEAGRAPAAAC